MNYVKENNDVNKRRSSEVGQVLSKPIEKIIKHARHSKLYIFYLEEFRKKGLNTKEEIKCSIVAKNANMSKWELIFHKIFSEDSLANKYILLKAKTVYIKLIKEAIKRGQNIILTLNEYIANLKKLQKQYSKDEEVFTPRTRMPRRLATLMDDNLQFHTNRKTIIHPVTKESGSKGTTAIKKEDFDPAIKELRTKEQIKKEIKEIKNKIQEESSRHEVKRKKYPYIKSRFLTEKYTPSYVQTIASPRSVFPEIQDKMDSKSEMHIKLINKSGKYPVFSPINRCIKPQINFVKNPKISTSNKEVYSLLELTLSKTPVDMITLNTAKANTNREINFTTFTNGLQFNQKISKTPKCKKLVKTKSKDFFLKTDFYYI